MLFRDHNTFLPKGVLKVNRYTKLQISYISTNSTRPEDLCTQHTSLQNIYSYCQLMEADLFSREFNTDKVSYLEAIVLLKHNIKTSHKY